MRLVWHTNPVFASQHFLLARMRRLPAIGSDHFPIFAVLDYAPSAPVTNEEPKPDAGDKQEAGKAIQKGKAKE